MHATIVSRTRSKRKVVMVEFAKVMAAEPTVKDVDQRLPYFMDDFYELNHQSRS